MQSFHRSELRREHNITLLHSATQQFSSLQRLNTDFDLRIAESFTGKVALYHLEPAHQRFFCLSPEVHTIEELERHVTKHMVDILNNYIFGDTQDSLSVA